MNTVDTALDFATYLVQTACIACEVTDKDPNDIEDVVPVGYCFDEQGFIFIVRMKKELDFDLQITIFKFVKGMEIQRLKAGEDARPPNSTPQQMALLEKTASELSHGEVLLN